MNAKRFSFMVLLGIILIYTTGFAQQRPCMQAGPCCGMGPGQGFGPNGFKNEEVKSFILEQRQQFNGELSEAEKQTIIEMREVVKQHRDFMRDIEPGELTRNERREIHFKHMEQLDPLFDIADSHRENLEAIHTDIRDFIGENCPNNGQGKRYRHGWGGRGNGMGGFGGHGFIRFLLLDPSVDTLFQASDSSDDNLQLFPNPAESELTVKFKLEKAEPVVIGLLDQSGNLVKELGRPDCKAGENTFSFNIGELSKNEIHFVRVKTEDDTLIRKFIRR